VQGFGRAWFSEFMESNSINSGFHATSITSKLVVISAVLPSMMLAEQIKR
jgi:hypothetical protein